MVCKSTFRTTLLLVPLLTMSGCFNTPEKKESKKIEKKSEIEISVVKMPKTAEEFDNLIKNKNAVLDFYAPWCGPCKNMKPIFEEIALRHKDAAVFVAVNNDESGLQSIFKKYGVNAFPTFVFVDASGKVVTKKEGGRSQSEFEKEVTAFLKKAGNP